MAFCEQCGNKLSETAKFCGKCGAPVSPGQTEAKETSGGATCAQCGAPLEEGELFCIVCGMKVGAAPQSLPTPIMQNNTFPPVTPNVVYINEEEGKKRVMNNNKLYAKLLSKFRTDTNLDDLENSVYAKNWKKAQAAARSIRLIAANLSLIELSIQSAGIEMQIQKKSVSVESMERLKNCFTETLVVVDKVIAHYI